ncbi:MAG: ribonuclease HII [Methanocalculus sp. MSAO_Arc1]|uniref:ribonuclease HII n=1 Tax=Methanocalculus TaxID=71151 RepID=UPI000FF85A66|nr:MULTISPECIES: ribonuclease HII [unclassified Methanocalculus]MCP1662391.1 ribonuclease HII [Methanocalculus sp. AMF5]RQD81365.1 MAG: ribonuclease HII [Methanocalculus sp. MSAO_Arc1]
MFYGVDEAGKGAVLGPMVTAAVGILDLSLLLDTGVRDSKTLSRERREEMFLLLEDVCCYHAVVLQPHEIDSLLARESMNMVVARAHAASLDGLPHPENPTSSSAYLDACDVNAERFGRTVSQLLKTPCAVISEHRADSAHRIVAAASIIAKVLRDRAIDELSEEYGDIGSGYPSDTLTIHFLKEYIREHGVAPPCSRSRWKTVSALLSNRNQSNLFDF